jgi:hypothetical protein
MAPKPQIATLTFSFLMTLLQSGQPGYATEKAPTHRVIGGR